MTLVEYKFSCCQHINVVYSAVVPLSVPRIASIQRLYAPLCTDSEKLKFRAENVPVLPSTPHTTPPARTAKRNVTLLLLHVATPTHHHEGATELRLRMALRLMADAHFGTNHQERTQV